MLDKTHIGLTAHVVHQERDFDQHGHVGPLHPEEQNEEAEENLVHALDLVKIGQLAPAFN